MFRFLKIGLLAALGFPSSIMAHEGHGQMPGAVSAPHGGQVKGTDNLYLELVSGTNGFTIYVTDHDMKMIALKDVKIEGTLKLPRQSQVQRLTFVEKGQGFATTVQVKGTHRYTVDLKVTHAGKTEQVSFNVEPK